MDGGVWRLTRSSIYLESVTTLKSSGKKHKLIARAHNLASGVFQSRQDRTGLQKTGGVYLWAEKRLLTYLYCDVQENTKVDET